MNPQQTIPMQRYIINTIRILSLLALLVLTPLMTSAERGVYTTENPLIIVCDPNLPPYEFENDKGNADGYSIEVLERILKTLEIPYEVRIMDWSHADEAFKRGTVGLLMSHVSDEYDSTYVYSKSIVEYYKLKVVFHSKGRPVLTTDELITARKNVGMRPNDLLTERIVVKEMPGLSPRLLAVDDALPAIAEHKLDYFIWGEEPLKWYMQKYGLNDELSISDLTIGAVEVYFLSRDRRLIDQIDDTYVRMDQDGVINKIYNKWFHPEVEKLTRSVIVASVTIATILLVLLLILINRRMQRRVRKTVRDTEDMERMLSLSLKLSEYHMTKYDLRSNTLVNKNGGTFLPPYTIYMEQFLEHMHPDDRLQMKGLIQGLIDDTIPYAEIIMRWKPFKHNMRPDTPEWTYIHSFAFLERDAEKHPVSIISSYRDVTQDFIVERKNREMANRFAKLFDNTLTAMSFYDREGQLLDLNQKMREFCEIPDDDENNLFLTLSLFEFPMIKGDFNPDSREPFYACQKLPFGENRAKYAEFRIQPTYRDNQLQYYVMMAREVTVDRDLYMQQSRYERELLEVNNRMVHYEKELEYMLSNSDMWVWRSDLATRTITTSHSLKRADFVESFEMFLDTLYDDNERRMAMEEFGDMKGKDGNFNRIFHYRYTPLSKEERWMVTTGVPVYDDEGKLKGHFGILRDVSKLMNIQAQLRRESNRAEDSGKLKSIFLANMTHEIRTPLNAIVGFSDLLQVIDDPTERREFIRIIRNNCDMLIRLINDIIEASNINQGPLAIEATKVDFAVAFNDICQTLAQRVQEPGVEFQQDNPYDSFVTVLDKGRMQQVITNFTTNAVKYTHEGHIKVGYSYVSEADLARLTDTYFSDNTSRKGLYMYCEDTGAGIPKEKQASVFERFVKLNDYVQGTGLGLSICKSIADRCEGHIGVHSEGEGHGSTFWIWVPCECMASDASTAAR